MSKIKVTGLELETTSGQKVKLTLAEAKELHEQLESLFGAKTAYVQPYVVRPWYPYSPYWTFTNAQNNCTASVSSGSISDWTISGSGMKSAINYTV